MGPPRVGDFSRLKWLFSRRSGDLSVMTLATAAKLGSPCRSQNWLKSKISSLPRKSILFAMNWLTTAWSSKRMYCLSPITRSRRGPPRESRNSFVARALSRQGSKCRILSVLMGSIFDRDRIRFSCFRYASGEIWTVPSRGATALLIRWLRLRKYGC